MILLRTLTALLALLAVLPVPARLAGTGRAAAPPSAPPLQRYSFVEKHMGTRFEITLYARDEEAARRASAAAFQRIAALNAIMSDYLADSELMRLCAKAGGPPVRVSDDLYKVLRRAQDVSARSDGAFDVTVGPV